MSTLTVGLLQIAAAGNDQQANLARGDIACREAKVQGADIALFPEMWSCGYTPATSLDPDLTDVYRSPERWSDGSPIPTMPPLAEIWQGLAITRDSAFVRHFRGLAAELDMAIGLTYLEDWPGLPRNTISLIDRRGEIVLTYAKVHTCVFSPHEAAITPGDEFPVSTLDTVAGQVRVGAMICYDREFPESARAVMLGGAELILIPSASSIGIHRLDQVRARAEENMVALAMANYPGLGAGHSVAYDGMAYAEGQARDTLVVEAGDETEGIYPARFDLAKIRDYRRRETWGNAFRRPETYGALTAFEVREPFVRVDHRGDPVPAARYRPSVSTASPAVPNSSTPAGTHSRPAPPRS